MPSNFLHDPLWYKDAVIYELHVRSFFDADDDGYGDFAGLRQKLPYLKSLGVNTLWLLPFLESPLRDDGYDIADYYRVLPVHGDLHDVRAFMDEANAQGMRVVTELVLNHTSDQHPWFQEARDPSSDKHDWYVWSDTTEKYADARIIFTDTEVSNWTWDQKAQKYYWHRFFSHQPDLNYDNPEVREAMKRVMFFWFDMGVDGLRLDAVPYLFQREGTNCENLPETLAYIEELRTAVDERYGPGKVLLAEANQWPEDTLPYFGDEVMGPEGTPQGTGVQMAFNFPIMPRMFMSLRRENRRPLVEMLDLTDGIPADAQWALFLRNHDELTLEMVTDEERDYMYNEYASDARFRINVGIRRRLAPLLGGDRRRIELMTALLLSLQGSPVLYYGDEIGMGDDPFLGDRNGVRTPMQWSPDKHGGFSRASAHRLFLPPVTDGRYGYQMVNVEDANEDPHSLLSFTKRILALRRQHVKVFGRGDLKVLPVENEAIFAFVRAYEGEKILVIANLARFTQSAFLPAVDGIAGLVPVELLGQTPFPTIEPDTPYHLLLGPHAWHWFVLKPQEALEQTPDQLADFQDTEAPRDARTLPRLQVTEGIQNLLVRTLAENGSMAQLEAVLPAYLQKQRWYGSKGRSIAEVTIADAVRIRREPRVYLTILEVHFDDGQPEHYLLPLTQVSGNEAERLEEVAPAAPVALVESPEGTNVLIDATNWGAFWLILFQWWQREANGRSLKGIYLSDLESDVRGASVSEAHPLRGEQSNSSALIDRRYYIKLYRRLVAGQNPEAELLEHLTQQQFEFIPQVHGHLYFKRGGTTIDIGILQEGLPVETDGWTYARATIGRFLDRAEDMATPTPHEPSAEAEEPPVLLEELAPEMLALASTLGVRTAEMHRALAAGEGPDLSPVPPDADAAPALAERLATAAKRTRTLLESSDPGAADDIPWDQLPSGLDRVRASTMAAHRIRIHGDYHLGQTIRATGELYILDFEGEPARALEERRAKDYAMRDVAGMLRSFDYAIHAAWSERSNNDDDLAAWSRLLYRWVEHAFLTSYQNTAGDAVFLFSPQERPLMQWAFLLEKALYEVRYEHEQRPSWTWLPLIGLRRVLRTAPAPSRDAAPPATS